MTQRPTAAVINFGVNSQPIENRQDFEKVLTPPAPEILSNNRKYGSTGAFWHRKFGFSEGRFYRKNGVPAVAHSSLHADAVFTSQIEVSNKK